MTKTMASHPESGFTLVETLVGLLILAISSGLLVQSISSASAQISSARRLLAAERVALSVLAEHSRMKGNDISEEGTDETSDLFWRYKMRSSPRKSDTGQLAAIETIEIEISLSSSSPLLYRLKALELEASQP